MSYTDYGTLILLQVLLQPVYAFGIEMVGGLVEQEHVGLLKEQAAQCHTTAFTTGQYSTLLVGRGAAECIHGTLQTAVQVPCVGGIEDVLKFSLACKEFVHLVLILVVFGQTELVVDGVIFVQGIHHVLHAFLNNLQYGLLVVQIGFLLQIAHAVTRTPHHFTLRGLFQTGDNLHQCCLTRTVQTNDANLCTIEETQVDVLQYLLLVLCDSLAHTNH